MNIEILDEPELEFASGARHVDIRFGLMNTGPLDVSHPKMRSISVGIVGTNETVEGLALWLNRCRNEIPGKDSPHKSLFPRFPGFQPDTAFHSTLVIEARTQRTIRPQDLVRLTSIPRSRKMIEETVRAFLDEMRDIADKARPDVLICAPPMEVWKAVKGDTERVEDDSEQKGVVTENGGLQYDFHDVLKARAMSLRIPVQLVWPYTYDTAKRRRQKHRSHLFVGQQDEATRAWNLHTALYYKSGGIPWRLLRDPTEYATCSVGISFYRSLEGEKLLTSMAQVFNERGDGVVVRGGQASITKVDRQPHLDAADAEVLLTASLATYRREHRNLPARIVVHKTSRYNEAERAGFSAAANRLGIEYVDFISIDDSFIRLFREGENAPLRGTLLSLDAQSHVLYTRGSVDFFEVYPGLYVPLPLLIRCEQTVQTARFLAREVLDLTKMNWNSTQFDGRDPITVRAARQVAPILRHIAESDTVEPAYSYYM